LKDQIQFSFASLLLSLLRSDARVAISCKKVHDFAFRDEALRTGMTLGSTLTVSVSHGSTLRYDYNVSPPHTHKYNTFSL